MTGSARPRDTCIDVSLFEFDDCVGHRTAKRTFFCSKECAIRGIEQDMLLTRDDPMFWVDRHGEGPKLYPEAEVDPLVNRARELLEEAAELNNCDETLAEHLKAAIERTGDSQDVLGEYPDVEYRCEQAVESALEDVEGGEKATDAAQKAAIEHGIPDRQGTIYGRLQEEADAS